MPNRSWRDDDSRAAWLNDVVELDEVLMAPLDVRGKGRRTTFARVLLQQLGFTLERIEGQVSDETLWVVFARIEPMADAVKEYRIDVDRRARFIAGGRDIEERRPALPASSAIQAMIDLGWSHEIISEGDIREVARTIRHRYIGLMADRVAALLHRWEDSGVVIDTPRGQ